MKITNPEVIKSGEKELIDAINADLDWGAIEETFRKEHKLGIEENVEYKTGDIIVLDSQVAYKLEFEVKVMLSVLVDREGNYISVASSADLDKTQDEKKEDSEESDSTDNPEDAEISQAASPPERSKKRFSKMASQVKEMISEINEEK